MKYTKHKPVMLQETIKMLNIKPNGIYLDLTLGFGGHAINILKNLGTDGKLYGFDQDVHAYEFCKNSELGKDERVVLVNENFSELGRWSRMNNINNFNGILFDLGVSSYQLDEPSRGFSYRFNGDLDMRMNTSSKLTAYSLLQNLTEIELRNVFKKYGQIKNPNSVVKAIVENRESIKTTEDLKNIILNSISIKEKYNKNKNPLTQYFLALRIAVNDELTVIEKTLPIATTLLSKNNGRLVVLTYHSLETEIVRKCLKKMCHDDLPIEIPINTKKTEYQWVTKKPIVPSEQEIMKNSRAKSAKLFCLERRSQDCYV